MDDNQAAVPLPLPIEHWLRFALAFADSTRLLRLLRRSLPEPGEIARALQGYLADQDTDLADRLQALDARISPSALFSPQTDQRCQRALDWQSQAAEHHLIGLDDPRYPDRLLLTDDAPPLLYARGDLQALDYPLLAVVGSRKASHTAMTHTRCLCRELADTGIGIVSGLALGIDAVAHEAALAAREANPLAGPTVALAATPADRVYPERHVELAERIVANQGLILTEYPLGSATRPWHFPRRNRLISGISLGVLVAEAALPSGTLTTAEHAINQGREVMAMPGSLGNPQVRGCHMLIRNGAALVEDARDVIEVLMPALQREQDLVEAAPTVARHPDFGSRHASQQSLPLDDPTLSGTPQEQALLSTLLSGPATLDELANHTGERIQDLAASLGSLETRGFITMTAGGRYARCQPHRSPEKLHGLVDKA